MYSNHHHHQRGNAERNAIQQQLLGILEAGVQAGLWQLPAPQVTASLIYAGVHGATDDLIAVPSQDAEVFIAAVVADCLRMVGVSPKRGGTVAEALAVAQAWARMFSNRPNGSRTKKRRTPQGSSTGPYSTATPVARTRSSTSCRSSTSIDRSGTGVPEPPSLAKLIWAGHCPARRG